MYSMQEQEHLDHEMGAASELQNAYWRSQSERKPSGKIPDDGRFHVIKEWAEYCPSTDAMLGTAHRVIASFDTREEADAEVAKLSIDQDEEDYDEHYGVRPRPHRPPCRTLAEKWAEEAKEAKEEADMPF